jgi:8-amino-3,8-dideoxy-alpha-D-manno-octulosonate transaminase
MPGFETVGNEERAEINEIFDQSNGVLFAHGFIPLRNNRYRVRELEKEFARKIGSPYAQAVTSGTVAQYVAMQAMGVRRGDEVITQAFTFVATVEAILALGAVPVIVDIDDTYNMDPSELEKAITPATKLIVPVHMLGNTADLDRIIAIGRRYGIPILEDACEALGASYRGKHAGTWTEAGVFSTDFQKTIVTGEGGFIVTGDPTISRFCREYHDHGHESNPALPRGRDSRSIPGMNFRMTELQAAVGLAQLKKLDYIVGLNRRNKAIVKDYLGQTDRIQFRRLTDEQGDLGDTIIFNFEGKRWADAFVKEYTAAGYHTKNIPDAIDWHFAGTWNQMFRDVPAYRDCWRTAWARSGEFLARSVAAPIYLKRTEAELSREGETMLTIIRGL